MPISGNARAFSGAIAEVVTFDIPGIDMEFFLGFFIECPEEDEDNIFTDLDPKKAEDFLNGLD